VPEGARPRVLIVITLAETGGAQSYVRDLVPALVERFDVVVAAYGPGPLPLAVTGAGARYVPLRHVRRAISPRDLLGLWELVRLMRRERPALVHANSSKAGVLARLAAVVARVPRRVFTAHGWAFKAASGAAATLYLWSDRVVRPLTTAVVCVSEREVEAGVAARTCGRGRTVLIHNAVDVAAFAQARPGEEARPLRVVSVGRIAAPKDFSTLVRAVAQLGRGSVELTVLGDGPERSMVEEEVAAHGLEPFVRLAGDVQDVPERLAAAHAFVLSSRSEGFPISVLEAMAAGLPVVASDVGGLAEAVAHGETGFLVEPGAAAGLAAALAALADDPLLRATLGAAGRERAAARFDLPHWREQHLRLYEQLLAHGHPGELAA
jgi:glycosyltransferase involved in cell wall biosynthesis